MTEFAIVLSIVVALQHVVLYFLDKRIDVLQKALMDEMKSNSDFRITILLHVLPTLLHAAVKREDYESAESIKQAIQKLQQCLDLNSGK